MLKGEIWWADLLRARGSEPAKTRPVLIVQSDTLNRSSVSTVMCASINTFALCQNFILNRLIKVLK